MSAFKMSDEELTLRVNQISEKLCRMVMAECKTICKDNPITSDQFINAITGICLASTFTLLHFLRNEVENNLKFHNSGDVVSSFEEIVNNYVKDILETLANMYSRFTIRSITPIDSKIN
jgi:hypothetical protein